ncbi:MAG: glycosyl transferase family 8 [Haloplasmataceae bacterium]|jgi:lipopolysaccharide biosynthesis glycosyltransferase|nr:glycosyl transferase family 8 [Haloplasmataceae bacterium]
MDILVTINSKYRYYLAVMLKSLLINNPNTKVDVYVMHSSLTEDDFVFLNNHKLNDCLTYHFIKVENDLFKDAPVVERYPFEIYYRIFSGFYLPDHLERILYLDPDIIINKSLTELYNMDFEGNYFIACTHIKKILHRLNQLRLNMSKDHVYVNTGVMLLNLNELRKNINKTEIYNFIELNKKKLLLPDQDIISALYGDKVKVVDTLKYNLSDRLITLNNVKINSEKIDQEWVNNNNFIIHFIGKNKPWKANYRGILKEYYDKYTI